MAALVTDEMLHVFAVEAPLDGLTRVEEISIVGPPSIWIGSSTAQDPLLFRPDQSFTEMTVAYTNNAWRNGLSSLP